MEDRGEDLNENLEKFLNQWKEEIEADRLAPAKRPSLSLPSTNDPPPLFVLPASHSHHATSQEKVCVTRTNEKEKKEKLVDTLIADLDEINTIPFFDVQLPREIALVIFKYLDMKDLCRCAMVSKSWNSLAEDDLLWHKVYQRISPSKSEEMLQWKSVVKEIVLQRRQVERNWKERICGLSDHQPDDCRVLCCLCYSQQKILSCYSSGALYVWDVSTENAPTRVKQILGPYFTSEPRCCDLESSWGVIGTSDGCLKIIDAGTCSQVYCLSDLGSVDSVSISCSDAHLIVGVASHHDSINVQPNLSVLVADGNTWDQTRLSLGEIKSQITKVKVISSCHTPTSLLYSTSSSLTIHPLHSKPTNILSSLGQRAEATCISCFELDRGIKTVACGTSAFGYQVQLFDLCTGVSKSSLKSHGQQVTSLSFSPCTTSSPHMLVSGSADTRVRVFDCRSHSSYPVLTLRGHRESVRCVQMDEWKVVSGSSDGLLLVWDQRMAGELWRTHERHPVNYCNFDNQYLVCGHIPLDKHPIRSAGGENPNICHRRLRGLVRVMDFSVDPLYYTRKLPSICSSNYDEPSASFYNLDLKLPYDTIS